MGDVLQHPKNPVRVEALKLQNAKIDNGRDIRVRILHIPGGKLPPRRPRGGGTDDSGGEGMGDLISRVTRLEQWFAGVVVGGLLIFAATAWALYSALSGRVDDATDRLSAVEASIGRIDERTIAMKDQLNKADQVQARIDEKLDRLAGK
jgi:hypothetical protein